MFKLTLLFFLQQYSFVLNPAVGAGCHKQRRELMKKIILSLSLLMSLGICAHDQSDLEQQLEVKKKQMDILVKNIIEQEAYVTSIDEKLQKFYSQFGERKRAELEKNSNNEEVTYSALSNIFMTEFQRLGDSFSDVKLNIGFLMMIFMVKVAPY